MRIMNFTDAYHMLKDVWKLYKKYAARKLTDAELESFTVDAQVIYKKYKTPFAKDIVYAVIEEIGRTADFMENREEKHE